MQKKAGRKSSTKKLVAKKAPTKRVSSKAGTRIKRIESRSTSTDNDVYTRTRESKYKVEADVPLSGARNIGLLAIDEFPFDAMKVGNSFLLEKGAGGTNGNKIHYAAKYYARFVPGFKITTRIQKNGQRRVWRIE